MKNAAAIISETGSYADKGEPSAVTMALVKIGGRYSITEEANEDTVLERFGIFQRLAAVAIANAVVVSITGMMSAAEWLPHDRAAKLAQTYGRHAAVRALRPRGRVRRGERSHDRDGRRHDAQRLRW